MKTVPKIISTKDLAYISDMLSWLHTNSKKLEHYTEIIEDNEVLNEIEDCHTMLNSIPIFDTL